jgi:hypothetical protein
VSRLCCRARQMRGCTPKLATARKCRKDSGGRSWKKDRLGWQGENFGFSVQQSVSFSSPPTHTSGSVCGIVAYRSRLAWLLVLSGLLRSVSRGLCGLYALWLGRFCPRRGRGKGVQSNRQTGPKRKDDNSRSFRATAWALAFILSASRSTILFT